MNHATRKPGLDAVGRTRVRYAAASAAGPGDFLGHLIDSRARCWLIPESLQLEILA